MRLRMVRRRAIRRIFGPVALVVIVSLAMTACGPFDSGGASPAPGGVAPAGGGAGLAGGCQQPGPLTSSVLPAFNEPDIVTRTNPCLSDLAGEITGLISSADRDGLGKFLTGVTTLANRLGQISDALECGYRTDALAIGVYQHTDPRWSVGVAVVLRGGLNTLAAAAACYIIDQIPVLGLFQGVNSTPSFTKTFCFNVNRQSRGNETYTIMWLGSSTVMCDSLQNQLLPGTGVAVEVRAEPNVAVRSAPHRDAPVIARAPNGSLGRVECSVEGDDVTGRLGPTNLWGRTSILGVTGYVSLSYLFTGDTVGPPALAPVQPCTT